jgi:hypothetical protein
LNRIDGEPAMLWKESKILWSPRLPKQILAQAYYNDACGLADSALLDDIGAALYLRCSDILYINDAQQHRWRCPRCEAATPPGSLMALAGESQRDARDNRYLCPHCTLLMTWGQFTLSYKRMQLNPGGAVAEFEHYIAQWARCREDNEKFLCIDRLVHAFHYSMKAQPDLPTRSAAVNLLQGKLHDIMVFLDGLSEGRDDPQTVKYREEARRWKKEWGDWWDNMEKQTSDKQR